MKVIFACQKIGGAMESVTDKQWDIDYPEIVKIHEEKMKTHPTWPMFGGYVFIGNREYQVSPQ